MLGPQQTGESFGWSSVVGSLELLHSSDLVRAAVQRLHAPLIPTLFAANDDARHPRLPPPQSNDDSPVADHATLVLALFVAAMLMGEYALYRLEPHAHTQPDRPDPYQADGWVTEYMLPADESALADRAQGDPRSGGLVRVRSVSRIVRGRREQAW